MSSCLSGGSRAFGFDLDIVKSTSTSSSSRNSPTSFSSPSSTLSESSNNALSTRKPRTPRKRPNQIYNEAAVLLSSVYPTIFPTKPCSTLPNINATTAPTRGSLFFDDSSELLPLHRPLPSYNRIKLFKNSPGIGHENPQLAIGGSDDFETSCILDEEMESIDTIMGVASAESGPALDSIFVGHASGIPYGLGLMMRRGVTALRQVDREDWWRFPVIDMCHISPRLSSKEESSSRSNHKSGSTDQKKLKKKKKNMEKQEFEPNFVEEDMRPEPVVPNLTSSLMLKLNYKEVVNAWSDRGWPFDEMPEPDAHAMMLAQIDLFGDGGGVRREASVLRYKEKRRTRLFSKKIIRYQVRKVNADCRPRMKGRFVRRLNCQTVKKI